MATRALGDLIGSGSRQIALTDEQTRDLLSEGLQRLNLAGKRVLIIIPDSTRSAPLPLMYRLLCELTLPSVKRLDFLIALGTHQPMPDDAIERLVGMSASERALRTPGVKILNHTWDEPKTLETIGTVPASDVAEITGGILAEDVPVTLNRAILDYDHLLICGPVFPHEVAGFSGGAKYLFPGIAGADIINSTHWLGALVTNMDTIGVKDTPVRRVIHRAAQLVPRPVDAISMVVHNSQLHGLFIGDHESSWAAAADLSGQMEIIRVAHPFKRVLSMPATRYDDLWTAAKAMYKTEPAIVDGGEVVIYAPHLTEVSYTHGKLIDETGYHVRDYFLKQAERFAHVPGMIKAHSTHVKGSGTYDATTGIESPRIKVTLATAIPRERCERINLGFMDYREIEVSDWENQEDLGLLVVRNAGEMLYRLDPST
ncbi:MAG TPA: lactate racemase domain-containing protein [Candidatus Dormibacteraeota bacterium]|nr:lactate racemase domain-containing protein [Candidatus Dormibacteraeota bacterium]